MHRTASWQAKPMNASNKVLLTRTLESAGKVSKAKLKLLEAGILLMARKGFGISTTLDEHLHRGKNQKRAVFIIILKSKLPSPSLQYRIF